MENLLGHARQEDQEGHKGHEDLWLLRSEDRKVTKDQGTYVAKENKGTKKAEGNKATEVTKEEKGNKVLWRTWGWRRPRSGLIYRVTHFRTRTREVDLLYTPEMPTAIVIIQSSCV